MTFSRVRPSYNEWRWQRYELSEFFLVTTVVIAAVVVECRHIIIKTINVASHDQRIEDILIKVKQHIREICIF